ncbi:Atrial natriuretic peptide receptor 1 [Stylophora pistillata]|uniref:Guanylate cyclase n=2 Tax=Stylophora pistillata TaxID=50429 RepID=A0A2B4STG4_STYPI|nr:Atrial natriuretic peptide receptor 1 [Stylophora pistillata]
MLVSGTEANYTLGLLIPMNDADFLQKGNYYASAMSIAVDAVNSQQNLLPGQNISFIWNDTSCEDEDVTIRGLFHQMTEGNVAAIIGPGCLCNTSARIAAAFNLPMISYLCSSPELLNKELYSTFVRTYTQNTRLAESVWLLLKELKWYKVGIAYKGVPPWVDRKDNIIKYLKMNGVEIRIERKIPPEDMKYQAKVKKLMEEMKPQARIIIIVADFFSARELIRPAHELGLTNGDYAFIMFELEYSEVLRKRESPHSWFLVASDESDYKFRCKFQEGFESVLTLALDVDENEEAYVKFQTDVKKRSPEVPFPDSAAYEGHIFDNPSMSPRNATQPPMYAAFLYDAVYQYAIALNKTLARNEQPNGKNIISKLLNREYNSISGQRVFIDKNGAAEADLVLLDVRWQVTRENCPANASNTATMEPVGNFKVTYTNNSDVSFSFKLSRDKKIEWPGGSPPKDSPKCGFDNEKCIPRKTPVGESVKMAIIAGISGFAGLLLLLFFVSRIRQIKLEKELKSLLWKINYDEIALKRPHTGPAVFTDDDNLDLIKDMEEAETPLLMDSFMNGDIIGDSTRFGIFKGTSVVVKRVGTKNVDLTRSVLLEMKQMLDIRHDNLSHFIGATVDPPNNCIVSEFYSRGSLQEILENKDVKLDHMFISSLVNDIAKGMGHLHHTDIKSHGSLKSSNCLVDSRWVLKIADYGLPTFRSKRTKTYKYTESYYEEIIKRVTEAEIPPFRPTVVSLITGVEELRELMKSCWEEKPEARPDFYDIKKTMHRILSNSGMKTNIFDNVVYMMEKYADNLEDLVSERTVQLMEEKKKTDALLDRILPRPVAEQLKRGKAVEAESFHEVSIYFSDIVGFTQLSSDSTPMQVVTFLNALYTLFDDIIREFDVYKVETIGDAYMVVSGLPIRNGDSHAAEIAGMALHLIAGVKQDFVVPHRPDHKIELRVGIHSGPVVAGVVGSTMPRYCLFGDTVNTASRMESTGEGLKIHISEATKKLLEKLGGFIIEERGDVFLKGKGTVKSYWLVDFAKRTPRFNRRSFKRVKELSDQSSGLLGILEAPPSPCRLSRTSSLRRTMKSMQPEPQVPKGKHAFDVDDKLDNFTSV